MGISSQFGLHIYIIPRVYIHTLNFAVHNILYDMLMSPQFYFVLRVRSLFKIVLKYILRDDEVNRHNVCAFTLVRVSFESVLLSCKI